MKLLLCIGVIVMSISMENVQAGPFSWMNKNWRRFGLFDDSQRGRHSLQNSHQERSSTDEAHEESPFTLYEDQPQDGSYQVREYPRAYWTSVTVSGPALNSVNPFMMLYQYISGNNKQNASIAMTVPVTITFRHRPCLLCDRTYTMSFYLPSAFQESPPVSRDSRVFTDYRRPLIAYVRTFSGLAKELDYQANAQELMKSLQINGIDLSAIEGNLFYGASYDRPSKRLNRRNEVWIVKA